MSYRERHPDMHQEEDIVPPRGVVTFTAVVLVVSAVLILWTVGLVYGSYRELRPSGAFTERFLGPRHLVARVRQDLFDERGPQPTNVQKRKELESWGWTDRTRGIVRVPIGEAMDLVLRGERR